MRGYVLPIVLALLLAAPMLWRMDGEVDVERATAARIVFQELRPVQASDDAAGELLRAVPLVPAADRELSGDASEPLLLPASMQSGGAP